MGVKTTKKLLSMFYDALFLGMSLNKGDTIFLNHENAS